MKYLVTVQPLAQDEMDGAWAWIAERAPLTAVRWPSALIAETAFRFLQLGNHLCLVLPEQLKGKA